MKTHLVILILAFLCEGILQGQNRSHNLNDASGIRLEKMLRTEYSPPKGPAGVLRMRELSVNPSLQEKGIVRVNDTILLDLFPDRRYSAIVRGTGTDINGTFTVTAKLTGSEYATCIISTFRNRSLVIIDIPEKEEFYRASRTRDETRCRLLEMDRTKLNILEDAPPLSAAGDLNEATGEMDETTGAQDEAAGAQDTGDTIKVMIVYTAAAAEWSDQNESGINNTISTAMSKAKLTLDNSNTLLTLHLVHSEQVDYDEYTSDFHLSKLSGLDDGYMDIVHAWRNEYEADLVALFAVISEVGGEAWIMTNVSGNPASGFSLTRVQQAGNSYTFIHEIGHNLGCHHHKEQNYQPGPGLFSYSAGWRWTGSDEGNYCSAMSYGSGSYYADGISHYNVPYFSNPDISHQGTPTGDALDGDNARTIRETKAVVADYRSPSDVLTILTPDGHYTWHAGTAHNITWYGLSGDNVSIEVCIDRTYFTTITNHTAGDGVYSWTIPPDFPAGNAYRIKITSNSDNSLFAYSAYFNLYNPYQSCDDEYEPNSDASTADTTAFDELLGRSSSRDSVTGTVGIFGDWDFYRLNIGNAGTLSLVLSDVPDGFDLQLFDKDENYVTGSFSSGDEEITSSISTPGYYYAVVGSVDKVHSCVPYRLNLSWAPEPPVLTVEPSSISAGPSEGSDTFHVTSNVEWSVSGSSGWLTAARADSVTFIVHYEENISTESRSDSITVTATGVATRSVTVTQEGVLPVLEVTPAAMSVGPVAGSDTFHVASNVEWSVSGSSGWLTAARADSVTLIVHYEENISTESRTGSVTVTGTAVAPQSVKVTQEGVLPVLEVTPAALSVGPSAGSDTFHVTSNVEWSASESSDWISLYKVSREELIAAYGENREAEERTSDISISGPGVNALTVTIRQQGAVVIYREERPAKADMKLYPNPGSDRLILEPGPGTDRDLSVYICNSSGILLYSGSLDRLPGDSKVRIDISGFEPGIYTVLLKGASTSKHLKFIKL